MQLITTRDAARDLVRRVQRSGKTVGVVPTMGALHAGHLSLVNASTQENDFTVVTIFVNPTQFAPDEDLDHYPRDLPQDMHLLDGLGVDMIFAPSVEELYGPRHSTFVQPPAVALRLEGEHRPEHFRGVTTIVLKLFQIISADKAYFGQKDYQQTRVIQDMVTDLDVATAIRICPIVREPDGLALSSRNAYLSADQRERALGLSQAMNLALQMFRDGARDTAELKTAMISHLRAAGIEAIDYVVLVSPDELTPVESAEQGTMVLVAAQVGSTRLIDNMRLE